jgi:hypothetical protein
MGGELFGVGLVNLPALLAPELFDLSDNQANFAD